MITSVRIVWNESGEQKQEFKSVVETLELQNNLKDRGLKYELHVLSDKADEYNGFDLLPKIWCRVG